jgi:UTP--glucose-1-phosphate uridylyltransferase
MTYRQPPGKLRDALEGATYKSHGRSRERSPRDDERAQLAQDQENPRMSPKSVIRTAVFPVAGRGTRFLPATKASPKEMLPVVDKPLIQYAVEEALAAGARRLVFVTGASKRAIEDHFDSDQELEHMLQAQGKSDLLNQLRSVLPSYASCIYIRQPAPLGLGHAVLCAQPAVGAEPFFVHLADDLIRSEVACLQQMAEVYEAKKASVLGVQVIPRQDTDKYGIVEVEADGSPTSRVRSIVEKPKPAVAPSNLAVVGRYVLAPSIFDHLERIGHGAGGEIQLTDGIAALMREEAVYAHRFSGKRYDCGSKLGYLQATVEYALGHPALGKDFRKYLRTLELNGEGKGAPPISRKPRSSGTRRNDMRRGNGRGRRNGASTKDSR